MSPEDVKKLAQAIAEANSHPTPEEWASRVEQAFTTPGSLTPPAPAPADPAPADPV